MLPGLNGIEVIKRLRQAVPIPVVMLTARGSEEDRVAGLELGADDYLAKPFSPRELAARVKAVLRRARVESGRNVGAVMASGGLTVDLVAHEAVLDGTRSRARRRRSSTFSPTSSRTQAERSVVKSSSKQVWGYSVGDTATITVHVRRLREKVEAEPSNPEHLCTVRGVGYRWAR